MINKTALGQSQSEATITIAGTQLTFAQSMTLRVAICAFAIDMSKKNALGSDDTGRAIAAAYRERSEEIIQLILKEVPAFA
jgi:hypothetical protein